MSTKTSKITWIMSECQAGDGNRGVFQVGRAQNYNGWRKERIKQRPGATSAVSVVFSIRCSRFCVKCEVIPGNPLSVYRFTKSNEATPQTDELYGE